MKQHYWSKYFAYIYPLLCTKMYFKHFESDSSYVFHSFNYLHFSKAAFVVYSPVSVRSLYDALALE